MAIEGGTYGLTRDEGDRVFLWSGHIHGTPAYLELRRRPGVEGWNGNYLIGGSRVNAGYWSEPVPSVKSLLTSGVVWEDADAIAYEGSLKGQSIRESIKLSQ